MNFFAQQQRARRASAWLGVFFVLTLVLVVAGLNLLVAAVVAWIGGSPLSASAWFADGHWAWLSGVLLVLILYGSWRRLRALWGHGDLLALRIGADNIGADTEDPQLRRLVNVVEEMAIAAGLPAPTLWVLSAEPAINAFVAGTDIDTTALVVTHGAVDALDRDQLQAVVAHEFGHIHHGDTRLNLQLTGVVAGLENLSQSGLLLLRLSHRLGARVFPLAAMVGLLLFLTGALGWLGGRLLRAAFSRQREFLADASAVRYTRNPQGLAGALARIRDHASGAVLRNPRAEEFSHFCFALPLRGLTANWLASHPSLRERILRIDRYFELRQRGRRAREQAGSAAARSAIGSPLPGLDGVGAEALVLAGGLIAALPDALQSAARSRELAPALVCALVLDADAGLRRSQLDGLRETLDADVLARVEMYGLLLGADAVRWRLPLLEMVAPQLRRQPAAVLSRLRRSLTAMSAVDGRLGLFELLVLIWLERGLQAPPPPTRRLLGFAAVAADLNRLLWVLIRLTPGEADQDAAFLRRQMQGFQRQVLSPPAAESLAAHELLHITRRLNQLLPMLKQAVLQACADCVRRDGELQPAEAEMLRLIALLLQAPAGPPLSANAAHHPRPGPAR